MAVDNDNPDTDAILRLLEPAAHLIAEEVDQLENRIWIPDPDQAFRMCNVVTSRDKDIVVGFRDENGFYEKKTLLKSATHATSMSHFCSDMCNLTELNEPSVLHTLRRRYDEHLIHTYSGLFCVVVNPWKVMPLLYSPAMIKYYSEQSKVQQVMPPHIYSVAQAAFDGILRGGNDQSILITGESGAGKTENTKKIIEYLICASDPDYLNNKKAARSIDSAVINSGIALEAFSNAKTIHNNNSSRLGKFIKINFDDSGRLTSAQIECYLLEKSRVVSQNKGDRNFHIFYQLLSNAFPDSLREALGLKKDAAAYKVLNQGGDCHDKSIDDITSGKETDAALNQLGFSVVEKRWIFECVAMCILIGEIRFGERSGMDYSFVEGTAEIDAVTKHINVKSSKLVDALTQPTIKVGENLIRKNQNLKKTLFSATALQKAIYERMFKWIVQKCNEAIERRPDSDEKADSRFIGVLDMAGFEIMARNSFEQFCINYTNEKLQQFFNHFMFVKEQAEYMTECIEWKQIDYGDDLQNTIDMVERPMGLLSYLQEECIVPNGSDNSLLEKMVRSLSKSGVFQKAKQSSRNTTVAHFVVTHYAGEVKYNIDGWVEKNRDMVDQCLLELMATSTHALIQKLFPTTPKDEMTRSRRGSLSCATVTHVYKEQLFDLLQTLNATSAHFIRCIVPNYQRQPFKITGPLVLHQLRCNGVLEGVRICRRGYPNRLLFDEFYHRYKLLAGGKLTRSKEDSPRNMASKLCELLEIDKEQYQIGKTKVFCRVGLISELENRRKDHINDMIVGLQAYIRAYRQLQVVEEKFEQWDNLVAIQHNVRLFAQLSNWKWFSLWSTVRQIIPMAREKRRIIDLEAEKNELLEKFKKLEEEHDELAEVQEEYEEEITQLKESKAESEKRVTNLQGEVKRNEDLLELMEKRFDEQHNKIMRLHSLQKENETNLERLEQLRQSLEAQLESLKERYQNEKTLRENLEEEFDDAKLKVEQAEARAQAARDEFDNVQKALQNAENNSLTWQERAQRQSTTITDLQHTISDLNERVNNYDSILHKERTAKRKCETDIDDLEEEIAHLKEVAQKDETKREVMKEQLRVKDNLIKKLEKKLEDKTDEMETCINELKKIHKTTVTDLQTQNDELKRKVKKLESETELQKIRLTDREGSVDSDCTRPSSRMNYSIHSSLGSRQYSMSSLSGSVLSLNSTHTLGRRSTTDYGSGSGRSFDLMRESSSILRSPSHSRLTRSVTQAEDYGSLTRSPSTSQLHEKERKISELERKLQTANTDYQLLKREIDVYKTQLQDLEREKESLNKQLRNANETLTTTQKDLRDEERKNTNLEQTQVKLNSDLETWKRKNEEIINESKNDIIAERKKHQDRISALTHEFEMKMQHVLAQSRADNKMQTDLIEAQSQLDRALATIAQMDKMSKSQFNIGDTWEAQYRNALHDVEELRDENASLKTKIRRQYKQIELLTQQNDLDSIVSELESKVDKFQNKMMDASMHESFIED
uniref:Myosin motor domain-containing protein n=1 Tax=Panagrellus redivivus TaxID=6233 RepID=A0A7E4ZUB9_PANRE